MKNKLIGLFILFAILMVSCGNPSTYIDDYTPIDETIPSNDYGLNDICTQEEQTDIQDIPLIIFTPTAGGTMVDTRIPDKLAHAVLRHFAAIESKDMDAFRDTLIGEDGVDMNHHIYLMHKYFENATEILWHAWHGDDAIIPEEHDWSSTKYIALGGSGLFVEEIGLVDYGLPSEHWRTSILRVVVTNNLGLRHVYMLLAGLTDWDYDWDFDEDTNEWISRPHIPEGRITRHLRFPNDWWWDDHMQQEMIIGFLYRSYPTLFMDTYMRNMIAIDYANGQRPRFLPAGFINHNNWELPSPATWFTAHEFFPGDITLVVAFTMPNTQGIVLATRVYRFHENDFVLLGEFDRFLIFHKHQDNSIIMETLDQINRITSLYHIALYEPWEYIDTSGSRHIGRTWHQDLIPKNIFVDVDFDDIEHELWAYFANSAPLKNIVTEETLHALAIRSGHENTRNIIELTNDTIFEPSNYTTIQASDEIQITIAHITDELLKQYDSFIAFSQWGRNLQKASDDLQRGIAFISNVPIRNFRYLSINSAEIQFIVEEDLFVLDKLLPNVPLLVDWAAMGSGAYGGFAFDDEFGTTRYFGFNYCAKGYTAFRFKEFMGDNLAFEMPNTKTRLYARQLSGGTAIWSNTSLPDFQFIEVLIGNAGYEKIYLYPSEILSSRSILEPYEFFWTDVLLVTTTISTNAISFLDENGLRIYFLLSISGYDGSIILTPYPLNERVEF